ncbi:MAG TPA: hypothetical protein VGV63_07880 [Acidimicrobiales bacterium]|nr:hypothetical protein [Acidimicrobiales bacterium]
MPQGPLRGCAALRFSLGAGAPPLTRHGLGLVMDPMANSGPGGRRGFDPGKERGEHGSPDGGDHQADRLGDREQRLITGDEDEVGLDHLQGGSKGTAS